jgi:predicted RNase H-like HicB family nuclease
VAAIDNSGTPEKHPEAVQGESLKRFLVIFEKGRNNYSAYSPDLPGCIATGKTRRQAAARMRQAIQMHLEGLREERLPIPRTRVSAEFIEVP